jgi:hypothetical protein
MPTKNTTYHYTWEELINLIEGKENMEVTKIISAGDDGIHCNMEEIKFEVPK